VPGKLEFANENPAPKPDVSVFDLLNAVNVILKRFAKRDNAREIFEDKWTVSEKIEYIIRVLTTRAYLRFSELFEDATSRSEVVCTFLALLELIRLKQLTCVQTGEFAEIEIRRTQATTPAPALEAEVATTATATATAPSSEIRNPQSP